jgi:flavodoxin I
MKKIGLFYSFHTQKTAKVAEKIQKALGEKDVEALNVEEVDEKKFASFDNLILGVSTWFDGELPNYWDEFVPAIEEMDLKGKKVAIFGLGDQVNYPENFCDGIGIMGKLMEQQGAELVGFVSTDEYNFESSVSVRGDKFAGLALDQENQARKTNKRIEDWVADLKKSFN